MRRYNGQLLYSASDLVTFLGCRHATVLDRRQLDNPVPVAEDDEHARLLQEKGIEHERRLLERFKAEGKSVTEIADGPLEERTAATLAAMREGAEVIYQGAFLSGRWHGFADFLIRVPGNSGLGDYHYEPLDTKLAHSPKPKHALQLAVYAELLASAQGTAPERLHIQLGTGETATLRAGDFRYYFSHARGRFEGFVADLPAQSEGMPCQACVLCRWRDRCGGEWEAADHLSLVARITGAQIEKLQAAGIATVAQLGTLAAGTAVEGIRADVLARLRSQAHLQTVRRQTGNNQVERLEAEPWKGFERLPPPDPGDLFFDMEGDPLFDGGLEYLFGFAYQEGAGFQPFWGHDRAQERVAFEAAMDFVSARLVAYPNAHIYHYNHYEETAIKRLAMLHGTREAEVDNLLRAGKLVDLYRVVREAIRVSEPQYSIKNLEVFYRGAREGEVSNAGESVVVYERWRKLQDGNLLQEIEDYNRVDCESTLQLRDWLLTLRPEDTPWRGDRPPDPEEVAKAAKREAAEADTAARAARLLQGPESERQFRQLVAHLLEFHKREDKPDWWFYFTRAQMMTEELIEDTECIGALERDLIRPPFREKQSTVHSFCFPAQDFKMRVGDKPHRAEPDTRPAGEIFSLNEAEGQIQLKCGPSIVSLGDRLSLMPGKPIPIDELRAAVSRYADTVVAGDGRYAAVTALLKRELPFIAGVARGSSVVRTDQSALDESIRAISGLQSSYLLVQGPPGAGKTYLSAHAIVALLRAGKRVAISANSHKAINRLLTEVMELAEAEGLQVPAVKKYRKDEDRCSHPRVANVKSPRDVDTKYRLVAGTAWLLCLPAFDQAFDYLFIDEAGQVSLGHLVAMGVCARNLVLVGDQMQLGQPIQGAHPGESGQSALDYMLKGYATIPLERGIFLGVTWRMHPDVCRFISEAVYEGRLQADPACAVRCLLVRGADPALKASGVSWVPVEHQECTQRSEEEGARVVELVRSLLEQRWIEAVGRERPITLDDILVVAPYNMQVNLLQGLLPAGARVGTVDKFQGQEAAVVIVSMTASSAEDVPRGMEFLYSRNRLNVAISRAKSLAIVVASPRLLEASCSKIEQMALVNTLCHAQAYAGVMVQVHS